MFEKQVPSKEEEEENFFFIINCMFIMTTGILPLCA
jgi:hypothetical protein